MPVVLAIGTTHPLNVAGLGLDARIANALGVRLVTVVAGISAQNAGTVLARMPVNSAMIAAQFVAVRETPVAAIHVGALLDPASVRAVARELPAFAGRAVVCDPVIAATGGDRLADDATVAALRDELFALCTLVTPNLDEAAVLLGRPISGIAAMETAARELVAMGAAAVLLKGGHLTATATDVLADAAGTRRFSGTRIDANVRGTGDLLACAIAARCAHGDALDDAIVAARAFVRGCLSASIPFAGTCTIP